MPYRFPNAKLEEIQSLVSRLTGDEMAFNQLFNPNPDAKQDNEVTQIALKIWEYLTAIKGNIEDFEKKAPKNSKIEEPIIKIIENIKKFDIATSHLDDSTKNNMILKDIMVKAEHIISDLENHPDYKANIRIGSLKLLIDRHKQLIIPFQSMQEAKEIFRKTIDTLQHVNDPSKPPPETKKQKRSLFANFFPRSIKVMDSSQLVRVPPEPLNLTIAFLTKLLDELQNTDIKNTVLKINNISELMKNYANELSANTPAILHNAISKLSLGLLDQCMKINNLEEANSDEISAICTKYLDDYFIKFLYTPAGYNYQLIKNNDTDISSYAENSKLSDEEIEIFESIDLKNTTRNQALLLFSSQQTYDDLYNQLDNALDYLYEQLMDEDKLSIKPRH